MLRAILAAVADGGRPKCLADLSRDLGIDEPVLEGMLETLVARGRLRALRFDGAGCSACPVKSGCYIMSDTVAVSYALTDESGTAGRAIATARSVERSNLQPGSAVATMEPSRSRMS